MLFKNRDQIIKNGKTKEIKEIRKDALEILTTAINSVNSYNAVKTRLDKKNIILNTDFFDISDFSNIYLVGFGKASIGMTQAVCDSFTIKDGVIITNELDKKVNNSNITTLKGSHPIPSQKSIDATDKLLIT
jgi:hydroxypyruvate reductase/glycerate 2-kinase